MESRVDWIVFESMTYKTCKKANQHLSKQDRLDKAISDINAKVASEIRDGFTVDSEIPIQMIKRLTKRFIG